MANQLYLSDTCYACASHFTFATSLNSKDNLQLSSIIIPILGLKKLRLSYFPKSQIS